MLSHGAHGVFVLWVSEFRLCYVKLTHAVVVDEEGESFLLCFCGFVVWSS
jgi:hypothetical protein